MELSKLLDKLSEKYPDEPMLDEALELVGEEYDDEEMNLGPEMDIDDEMEPAPEDGEEVPELDALLGEDLAQGDDDEDEEDPEIDDAVEPVPMASKKKKKPGMFA